MNNVLAGRCKNCYRPEGVCIGDPCPKPQTTYRRSSADVARIILANPDGTYSLDGERIIEDHGYEVGGYDPDMPQDAREGHTESGQLVGRLAERIFHLRREARPGHGIQGDGPVRLGRWTDDDGRVHLDATRHIPQRGIALGAASILGEQAIWDWAAGESLEVV